MSMALTQTLRAIADPTRRAILEQLRERELSVGELQSSFRISQPAVSRHLGVLREARLVRRRRRGRSNFYALTAAPIAEIVDWASRYNAFWEERLTALGQVLTEEKGKSR